MQATGEHLPTLSATLRRRARSSESLYSAPQPKAARTNLRRIDSPPCSDYSVIEVAIPKNHFEKHHSQIVQGRERVMSDSAREEHAAAFEPSSYAMRRSVVPPAFERGALPEPDNHTDHNGRHELHHRTANHRADPVVQVSPPDAVTRQTASGPGMAVEIVQDNRRGRIDYRYCSPLHMLVVHERGVRHDGCTVIEGLPQSTLQDCSRKLVFVPAGHEYHDWHEPRTLSRVVFFYFNPIQLAISSLGCSRSSLSPRIFFEDSAIMQTALKLATLIEDGDSGHRQYLEALGVVLAHELMRINTGTERAEAKPSGGLAAWQRRKAVAYIEEHLAEPISLEALARLVGLSACYFCRAFRQSTGMPPQRYQLSQRIERAKTLLAKRAASVTDVSLTVGYNDTSAFCTAFRRVTGLTPSTYRRNFS
jgi:AraC family transcriptional regulator